MAPKLTNVARALALCLLLSVPQFAQEAKAPAADNTKINKRDRDKTEPTADRAKDNVNDRDIMQKIRQAVMDDKTLSTYAHNVKIVSQRGKVTLKGPVRSAEEKSAVAAKATEVVGAGNVTDQMTIKPEKKKAS
jgi:osmotically-inducible protein OsmY